ncbi:hypothetical protein WJX72_000757 [[Myrmecia] bisecta]|uniref:Transmembrane protein n=1 Tax=[Myrmecia] bisecta TaxID=41462 RepID=A0AAW1R4T8_9CHLO
MFRPLGAYNCGAQSLSLLAFPLLPLQALRAATMSSRPANVPALDTGATAEAVEKKKRNSSVYKTMKASLKRTFSTTPRNSVSDSAASSQAPTPTTENGSPAPWEGESPVAGEPPSPQAAVKPQAGDAVKQVEPVSKSAKATKLVKANKRQRSGFFSRLVFGSFIILAGALASAAVRGQQHAK